MEMFDEGGRQMVKMPFITFYILRVFQIFCLRYSRYLDNNQNSALI